MEGSAVVSLVKEECEEASNSLRVNYNPLKKKEKKEKFAICSKSVDYQQDISIKLGKASFSIL